jgi:hypothetical protein
MASVRPLRKFLAIAFAGLMSFAVVAPISAPDAIAGPANGLDDMDAASVRDTTIVSEGASPREASAMLGACGRDMIEVQGRYCPDLDQKCLRFMIGERNGVERCAQFAPSGPCKAAVMRRHFCIDRFEYPNRQGERPIVMKSWTEAQEICRGAGKRLCGDREWTLACEGGRRLPYPYGTKRDARACNIDRVLPRVDERALADPSRSSAEVARLWQGEPSGSRPHCVSPFGVADMTGNVDEWVINESGKPFRSGSKGGYWGPVRARCRPMTTGHGETFSFYQTGFRCCADAH